MEKCGGNKCREEIKKKNKKNKKFYFDEHIEKQKQYTIKRGVGFNNVFDKSGCPDKYKEKLMNEYLNRRSNECVEMHLSQIVNNGSFEKRINIDDWTNRNNPMYKKLNNNHNYHWNYKYNHNDIKFLQINVNNRNSNNNNGNKNNKNNGQSFDINIQPMVLIKLN